MRDWSLFSLLLPHVSCRNLIKGKHIPVCTTASQWVGKLLCFTAQGWLISSKQYTSVENFTKPIAVHESRSCLSFRQDFSAITLGCWGGSSYRWLQAILAQLQGFNLCGFCSLRTSQHWIANSSEMTSKASGSIYSLMMNLTKQAACGLNESRCLNPPELREMSPRL